MKLDKVIDSPGATRQGEKGFTTVEDCEAVARPELGTKRKSLTHVNAGMTRQQAGPLPERRRPLGDLRVEAGASRASKFTGWTVVDFKTDREIEKSRDRYAAQVAVYVEAITISTGDMARGLLLIV